MAGGVAATVRRLHANASARSCGSISARVAGTSTTVGSNGRRQRKITMHESGSVYSNSKKARAWYISTCQERVGRPEVVLVREQADLREERREKPAKDVGADRQGLHGVVHDELDRRSVPADVCQVGASDLEKMRVGAMQLTKVVVEGRADGEPT